MLEPPTLSKPIGVFAVVAAVIQALLAVLVESRWLTPLVPGHIPTTFEKGFAKWSAHLAAAAFILAAIAPVRPTSDFLWTIEVIALGLFMVHEVGTGALSVYHYRRRKRVDSER